MLLSAWATCYQAGSTRIASPPEEPMSRCRLYLISPPKIGERPGDQAAFADALSSALDGGDVGCFQLRLKSPDGTSAPDDVVLALAERLIPICARRDVAILLNDRPDLAKACGADGVHLGQSDVALGEARALLGEAASIGVTCHDSRHLALVAGENGADYVAFGAFFPTRTKDVQAVANPAILTWWQAMTTVPCVAIGGINATNCGEIVRAGADFIAVSGAVWSHPSGPGAAVAELNAAIDAHAQEAGGR